MPVPGGRPDRLARTGPARGCPVTGGVDAGLAAWAAAHARSAGRDPGEVPEAPAAPRVRGGVTAHRRHVLKGHDPLPYMAMAWSPEGLGAPLLATGSADGTVRVWDPVTGETVRAFRHRTDRPDTGPGEAVSDLDWYVSPDSGDLRLVTVGADGVLSVWNASTGVLLDSLQIGPEPVVGVVCLQDFDDILLVAIDSDGVVRAWEPHTWRLQYSVDLGRGGFPSLSHRRLGDGRHVLAVGRGGVHAVLLDGRAGVVLGELGMPSGVRGLTGRAPVIMSTGVVEREDGSLIVAAGWPEDGGRITTWNVDDRRFRAWHRGDPLTNVPPMPAWQAASFTGHAEGVLSVSWLRMPHTILLGSAGSDGVVRIWSGNDQCVSEIETAVAANFLAWGPARAADVAMLAVGCLDGDVQIWEVHCPTDLLEHRTTPRATARSSSVVVTGGDVVSAGPAPTQAVGWDVSQEGPARLLAVRRGHDEQPAAVLRMPDGTVVSAVGAPGRTWVFSEDENHPRGLFRHGEQTVRSVALVESGQGHVLVATAGEKHGVHIGELSANGTLTEPPVTQPSGSPTTAVALGAGTGPILPTVLAAATSRAVHIYLVADGSLLADLPTPDAAHGMAFTARPGVSALLAAGGTDYLGVWESWDGTLWENAAPIISVSGQVRSVDWARLPHDGRLLAAGLSGGRVLVWDWPYRNLLFEAHAPVGRLASVALAVGPDERVWLAVGGSSGWMTYELLVAPREEGTPAPPFRMAGTAAARTAVATDVRSVAMPGLFALGQAGMWQPLGLLEDMLTLTATTRDRHLHDDRLGALRDNPGVRRLRELEWPARSRVALAGLLLADADQREVWVPPEGSGPAQWRAAFRAVPPVAAPSEPPPGPAPGEVAATADRVGERTVAMLTLLGPDVAAADPGLVLRLIGREHELPPLGAEGLRLLAAASLEHGRMTTRVGTSTHVPGAVGVSRHGLPDRLLHTQLALPKDILMVRQVTNELLYRQHSAFVPPRPTPVTLVLDTTPPVFGRAEGLLRMVGHLVTLSLWQQGEHPLLVTAGKPAEVVELTGPAQLIELWTARTLHPPDRTLPVALDTARGLHRPVVLLTHQHAPLPDPVPHLRLVTTCQPGEPPAVRPSNGHHHVLPPDPPADRLVSVVGELLTAEERRYR
ncbi:hypothetical protein [Streptomyces spongiae]|uniref:hypothetical protein n=1 Tax=Streptomyces spongiae TaxID=565072 RepID=UPI002AD4557C|nr:hypothetical protein [Streptomyces spongiae]